MKHNYFLIVATLRLRPADRQALAQSPTDMAALKGLSPVTVLPRIHLRERKPSHLTMLSLAASRPGRFRSQHFCRFLSNNSRLFATPSSQTGI